MSDPAAAAPPPKRAPMKVNPVTGKMEAVAPAKAGEIRDGSLRLPAKYLTAALDAGLGGSNGARPSSPSPFLPSP